MNKPVTRYYIFCGLMGGLAGVAGLPMDDWRYWAIVVWAVVGCAWVHGEKK